MSDSFEPLDTEAVTRHFGLSPTEAQQLKDVPVGHFSPGVMCQQDWAPSGDSDQTESTASLPMRDSSGQPDGVNLDSYWAGPSPLNP